MDENHLDENLWDKTYIGLNKMWTKNNETKIIWTKLAWEQRVRDGFKTQPPVDRRFCPVPAGFYCSKQ